MLYDEDWMKKVITTDFIITLTKDRAKHNDSGLVKFKVNRLNPNEDFLYILDTPFNRDKMICAFGESKLLTDNMSYIQFDKLDLSWRPMFTHEWLYRDKPLLVGIEEIIETYSK
jgi:hypothetical protein